MKLVCHVSLFVLLLLSGDLYAGVVKGTVTDDKGKALQGVSVKVKNSSSGTFTDSLGSYSLDIPDPKSILEFSFIGYITQEKQVGDATVINLALTRLDGTLDDVVVIGYGTQNTRTVSSSIVSLRSKQLE